jgi:hypothetical protein
MKQTSFSFTEFPQCGLVYALMPSFNIIQLNTSTGTISLTASKDEQVGVYNTTLAVNPKTSGAQLLLPLSFEVINACYDTVVSSRNKIPNINELILAKPILEFPLQFEHSAQNNTNCGTFDVTVRDPATKQVPTWAMYDGSKLKIDLSTQTQPIKGKVELLAWLKQYPERNYTQPFNVTLSTFTI